MQVIRFGLVHVFRVFASRNFIGIDRDGVSRTEWSKQSDQGEVSDER